MDPRTQSNDQNRLNSGVLNDGGPGEKFPDFESSFEFYQFLVQ